MYAWQHYGVLSLPIKDCHILTLTNISIDNQETHYNELQHYNHKSQKTSTLAVCICYVYVVVSPMVQVIVFVYVLLVQLIPVIILKYPSLLAPTRIGVVG